MVYVGQRITNSVTGQTILFQATDAETDGERFQAEGIFRTGGFAGVLHVHPYQEEHVEVTQGTAGFRLGRRRLQLGEGERIRVPAGTPHTFWNAGADEMRVIFAFRPALRVTGQFYAFYFGLAQAGQAGRNGLPRIWQMALQANEFSDHVRLASPSWAIQRLLFMVLRPIARLLGYRSLDFSEQEPHRMQGLGDREVLRAELAATRAAFHELLDGLTDDDLRRQSANPAWTVGAVLTHLVWSLELLPREVASARRGKGMYNIPPFLRDRLNAIATRLSARGQTVQKLRRRYDTAYDATRHTLERVRGDEFDRGARFWSEGFRDIRDLFHAPAHHLTEHGDDVRQAVAIRQAGA